MMRRDFKLKAVAAAVLAVGLAAAGAATAFQQKPGGGPPPPPPPPPPLGTPYQGLDPMTLGRWNAGKAAFLQPANPQGGLGPVFTEASCVKCHDAGATGGAGTRLVTHFGRVVNGQFDPMTAFGGPQVQDNGIGAFNGVNFVGEVVPKQATIVAKRRTIPLFGLGLVDSIPDSTLIALAEAQAEYAPQTAGSVSLTIDPTTGLSRVGRFGWKAQEPTLLAFAADALVNEIGVTTPFFPLENPPQGRGNLLAADPAHTNPNDLTGQPVATFADFMTFTAPPPRGPVGANETAGAQLFASIGCTSCHAPTFQAGPSNTPALNGVLFSPYSDFLLHDMGALGDGIVQGSAGPTQMRTAPLWGLRYQPSFLHDGRAPTPDSAVRQHAGQGAASAARYAALTATQRAQLIDFLNSL